MDNRQKIAVEQYTNLANSTSDLANCVGREIDGVGKIIWDDIKLKANIQAGETILDLGCGFGEVSLSIYNESTDLDLSVVFVDIQPITKKILDNWKAKANISLVSGIFPDVIDEIEKERREYDVIVAYSVLHYTDQPKDFIEKAVSLLAPGGRLFLAVLPNINKRGRFVSPLSGRSFEANWKNIDISELPIYETHIDFQKNSEVSTPQINDDLILWSLECFRCLGFDVYVLPQTESLPYCYTREDLLIVRPY